MPHVEHIKNCKDLPSERKHKEDVAECDEVKASPASNYESLYVKYCSSLQISTKFSSFCCFGEGEGLGMTLIIGSGSTWTARVSGRVGSG